MYSKICLLTGAVFAAFAIDAVTPVQAIEYPIGTPKIVNGMEIGAVFLQPVTMDPPGMMREAEISDIHLEADIHAVSNNLNGFAEGDWVPYLVIKYTLKKFSNFRSYPIIKGKLMPMVANDGPHYGDNVKLKGI